MKETSDITDPNFDYKFDLNRPIIFDRAGSGESESDWLHSHESTITMSCIGEVVTVGRRSPERALFDPDQWLLEFFVRVKKPSNMAEILRTAALKVAAPEAVVDYLVKDESKTLDFLSYVIGNVRARSHIFSIVPDEEWEERISIAKGIILCEESRLAAEAAMKELDF